MLTLPFYIMHVSQDMLKPCLSIPVITGDYKPAPGLPGIGPLSYDESLLFKAAYFR